MNGIWTVKTIPLYGSYVFAYSNTPISARSFYGIKKVCRVLQYDDGNYNLYGDDRIFGECALEHNGHIGISQAIKVGDRTKIIVGPLKDYEGTVLKYDRHKQRALVDVTGTGNIAPIWMYTSGYRKRPACR